MFTRLLSILVISYAFSAYADDATLLSAPESLSNVAISTAQTTDSLTSSSEQTETKPQEKNQTSITLARPGSKLKNPYADLVNLGLTGKSNSNIKTYADAAAQYCKTARDESDVNALFALAWLYTNGRGVDKNENTAALLFSMAAERGHASAKTWLSNSKGISSQASMPACLLPDPPANIASVHQESSQKKNSDGKPFYSKGPIYKLVSEIAPRYDVDIDLVMAFIAVESGFNPQATSPMNAQGLMQLIPETAARFNVKNAYNSADNIKGGVAYIQWLLAYFKGDIALVAAAYNAGENAVTRYKGIPPYPETRAYVKKITALYAEPTHAYRDDLGITPAVFNANTTADWSKVKITKP